MFWEAYQFVAGGTLAFFTVLFAVSIVCTIAVAIVGALK